MTVNQKFRRRPRVIPTLLMDSDGRLVKTTKFAKRDYIGDPINAVQIFNKKEVDELILMDIDASREGRAPHYASIEDIVSEAFMPVAYGGGIKSITEIEELYKCGIEKVILSSALGEGPMLATEAAARFGEQAVVACLQVKSGLFGRLGVRTLNGKNNLKSDPVSLARALVDSGVGELIIYSIDRDGTYSGYDLDLLGQITDAVDVPVVACGGARGTHDFLAAIEQAKCSAVAAGSIFVYQAKDKGVLITYPSQTKLREELYERISP
ncbi:MAG: AglZ/HisF2 family acetamidino modification protein [Pseudomonadota bacterium]